MKNYTLTKDDYNNFKKTNLKIRHLIADLELYLQDNELKTYQKFLKYSENLEKRLFIYTL